MSLAVCLLFDGESNRRIRQLWQHLEDVGVGTLASHTHGRHYPHLSYAVLREWDVRQVQRAVESLPDGGPITLSCQGSLCFPRGRVALAPAGSAELSTRQERAVCAIEQTGAVLHKHYRSGYWVPHISVATRAPAGRMAEVTRIVADVLPLMVRVEHAALIDSGTGQTWPLAVIP